jgi:hypothetical protein
MSSEQPLENVGYFQDDLVIAFKTRPISKNKNILTTCQCNVYIKELEGYRQIGLIQELHITAGMKDVVANVSISFPKKTSKLRKFDLVNALVTKNKKALTALGVTVK